jgi:hypothetical protein
MNYNLLNGLYLPQLKDMMLAAYLLRGKDHAKIYRSRGEMRDISTSAL